MNDFKKFKHLIKKQIFLIEYYFLNKKPISKEKTIDLILRKHLSVARYGDGEFMIIGNKNYSGIGFQKNSQSLRKDLVESFTDTSNRNLLICITNFRGGRYESLKIKKWHFNYVNSTYPLIKPYLEKKYIYGNAGITRFYHPWNYQSTNFKKLDNYVRKIKKLWENRNILIVEGKMTKLGLGNNLFDNSLSIKRILCPTKNSYSKIKEIYSTIMSNLQNVDLILCALGPTASILASWVSHNSDKQFIDIGHIDVIYLWYQNKATECCNIEGKYVNEANKNAKTISISYNLKKYKSEIIAEVE